MDGVITMEDARSLVGDAKLWPRVRDFLWDFAPQVHESWLSGIPGLSGMAGNPGVAGSLRVKRYILNSLGVKPCFHLFPKDDGSRLLLLDGAILESTAKWLGALACADSLRRVTDGATVRELKSTLRGIYPEVFGFAEYFRKLKVENVKCAVEGNVTERIVRIGSSLLFALIGQLPKSLSDRLKFKLPKTLSPGDDPDFQLLTFNFQLSTLQLLLKLRFPEAYELCC